MTTKTTAATALTLIAATAAFACNDDRPYSRGNVEDAGDARNGSGSDAGSDIEDVAIDQDTLPLPDSGGEDAAVEDTSAVVCASLDQIECLQTPGCVLDQSLEDFSYFCRDARNGCERLDASECVGNDICEWYSGFCYCPPDALCSCGDGPAPMCRRAADPMPCHTAVPTCEASEICCAPVGSLVGRCGAPELCDPTEPPPVPDVCEVAIAKIEGCFGPIMSSEPMWPGCSDPQDRCEAECAAGLSCGGLACEWDPDIDCDGPGPYGTCAASCRDIPAPCETDEDCGVQVDCCLETIECVSHLDPPSPPIECDLDCDPPLNPEMCACVDGRCGGRPIEQTICEAAIENFTGCGYDLHAVGTWEPHATRVPQMMAGECSGALPCYAGCMAFGSEDPCMACDFGPADCMRSPFGECVESCEALGAIGLCEETGGTWDDSGCGCCDGALLCGQEVGSNCMDACCGPPQCGCPPAAPYWSSTEGCIAADACP